MDMQLSPAGISEAEHAAQQLETLALDGARIVSSPVERAEQYATVIAQSLGLSLSYRDELKENGYGWEIIAAVRGHEREQLFRFLKSIPGGDLIIVSHQPPIQDALKLLGVRVVVEKGSIHHTRIPTYANNSVRDQ